MSRAKAPEAIYEQQAGQAILMSKVLELPIKYREVILLFYYQEFTGKEISQLLGCPENTVKTRLKRAKTLLKSQVDPQEWEGLPDEQL
jgi:RNA polymerase sigma-70 factor (ECF subfamily)